MRSYILAFVYLTCILARAQSPEPTGFVEQWVMSQDRAATLKLLIPGTDDYFFYHALHYQHTGEQENFTSTMKKWDAAIQQKKISRSPRYAVMEKRGIILDYKDKPAESIRQLSKLLDLELNHQRPTPPDEVVLSSKLDPATISPKAFEKEASSTEKPYEDYYDHRVYQEIKHGNNSDRAKRLWLLKNITHAGTPGTAQLFLDEIKHKSKPSFESISGNQHLFLEQLQWLKKQHPALREQSSFVHAVIKRMRPGDAHYLLNYPAEKQAWLQKSWNYVSSLSPTQSSLKAHILYHLLDSHQLNGQYPEPLLLEYLAIPRTGSEKQILHPNTKNSAELTRNFTAVTTLPAVNNDDELLQTYLLQILAKKDSVAKYSKLLPVELLTQLHAEAKLLSGADSDTWGNRISPESFQQLHDKTEVSIAPQNKRRYGADDDISLQLNLKNTPSLDIQIYQIDSLSHITRTGEDPEVSIKLNGLVPHYTLTKEFPQAPLLRHEYTVPLPQLKGRGIWIIECISKGESCRALIKKGGLQLLLSDSTTGQSAVIIDENQNPLPQAQLILQGATYKADPAGTINIPLASSARTDKAIVHIPDANGSGLAESHRIGRRAIDYSLSLAAGTDREQLLSGKKATLLLRPLLTSNGLPISIKQLENVSLHINATLRGGIHTELTADNISFNEHGITTCSIAIPEDVRAISISINGDISIPGRSEPTKLTASTTMSINGTSDTHLLAQPLFAFTEQGWVIHLLGRNGEPLPKRALEIELRRHGFDNSLTQTLRTDTKGKIYLGNLHGIESIDIAKTDFSNETSKYLTTKESSYISTYRALSGEKVTINLPSPIGLDAYKDYSCLYLHHGDTELPVQDMSQHLDITDDKISINNLPVGHYTLEIPSFSSTYDIHIIEGKRNGPWISNSSHSLSYHNPAPLEVSSIQTDNETITGSVSGADKETRLLVIGSRYFSDGDRYSLVHHTRKNSLSGWEHSFSGNQWLNGRQLSDEYRYILERRQAKQFIGNMLPRPGLILNRWKRNDSDIFSSDGGDVFGGSGSLESTAKRKMGRGTAQPKKTTADNSNNYDFLSKQSVIHTKIEIAPDGSFSFPAQDFAHCQSITVLAYNAEQTSYHTLPLPEQKLTTRERRLDRNLDPEKHYVASQTTAILKKDASAEIRNVLDADWRAYTALGHVHDYFHTNAGSNDLRAFALLMQWPKLNDQQRKRSANLLASHEFHLFAYFKDRQWFNENIKPTLEHKRHRTFIDHFLLGENLEHYLEPWKYQRLNAAEKALLARSLPAKRDAIVKDLQHRFQLSNPSPEQETQLFASALQQNSLALRDRLGLTAQELSWVAADESSASATLYIQEKLNNIIIPVVDFEDTSLPDALNFLRIRCRELDSEPAPALKGLNFNVRGTHLSEFRIRELKLRNTPLITLLQHLCDITASRYKVTAKGVTIFTLDGLDTTELSTRKFIVPPGYLSSFNNDDILNPTAQEFLERNGIEFPPGSSAKYIASTSTLIVYNTHSNLDNIEQLTESIVSSGPPPSAPRLTGNIPYTRSLLPNDSADEDSFSAADSDSLSATLDFGEVDSSSGWSAEETSLPARQFSPAEPGDLVTHIWSESNYYRVPNLENGPSIAPNRFWIEFAAHDGESPFLSARFPECTGSNASMLIALAVLDLPFAGEKPEVQMADLTLKVQAKSPMLLFYRDTRETKLIAERSPLLVQQKFFRYGDRTRTDDTGQEIENPVTADFLVGVPYTASFIIINPTGTARELQVLTQIPRGSISLGKTPPTEARDIKLKAHSTTRIEYSFYFPSTGVYPHFPAHVLEQDTVLASAEAQAITVLDYNAQRDTRSWAAVARDGTDADVLARMRTINLHQTPLQPILWRLSNKEFYQSVITLLQSRLYYHSSIYAYGFKHADRRAVADYLENANIANHLGSYFSSPLITLDNRERGSWEHLEFAPTVNARQHKFQGHYQLLNREAQEQYLDVLDAIAWKPAPSQDDLLTLSYQLFLQDRAQEALELFARVDPEQTEAKMQYDYMHCYALFYQEKPDEAAEIAQRWQDVKSDLWKKRFSAVTTQAQEISGLHTAKANDQKTALPPTPSLEMQSKDQALAFDIQSIQSATLSLYAVDLEVLFSENPFLDKHTNINPPIQPNHITEINFPDGASEHLVQLPENMQLGNVLAIAKSGTLQRVLALDSQAIRLTQDLSTKTLRVTEAKTNKPLPRSYVKIYVETTDGETLFFKDGYTDLRGQFPYQAHTRIHPHSIKRYAIFTTHAEFGSKILITK